MYLGHFSKLIFCAPCTLKLQQSHNEHSAFHLDIPGPFVPLSLCTYCSLYLECHTPPFSVQLTPTMIQLKCFPQLSQFTSGHSTALEIHVLRHNKLQKSKLPRSTTSPSLPRSEQLTKPSPSFIFSKAKVRQKSRRNPQKAQIAGGSISNSQSGPDEQLLSHLK